MNIKTENTKNISKIDSIILSSKVLPIVVISNVDDCLSIAEALLNGGINIMEITLRTKVAFKAIESVIKSFPEMKVGVGTVVSPAQLIESSALGAHFAVSPGLSKNLLEIAEDIKDEIPLLPGISNPSQIMSCINYNFHTMKFFPAEYFGGVDFLKSIENIFPNAKFCPTGGINFNNAKDYLSLSNVLSVGGSFVVPKNAIENKNWNLVTEISKKIKDNL